VTNDRRLIEEYLPIEAVSKEAARYYDIPADVIIATGLPVERRG